MKRLRNPWAPLILAALFVLILAGAGRAADWPRPSGPVADYAGVLSAKAKAQIAAVSQELWQKTGAAVVVATVPSLGQGHTIDSLAVKLFEDWGIGGAKKDEGILLLVALKERKIRMEVGYGLEGVITDAMSRRIVEDNMKPYLRSNDFDRGLLVGAALTAQVIAKDKGVQLTGMPKGAIPKYSRKGVGTLLFIVLIIAFVAVGMLRRGVRSGRVSGTGLLAGMMLGSMMGGGHRGGGGFSDFGGGFGGFGGGMSGGGGFSGDF